MKLIGKGIQTPAETSEGVSFDGSTDYLSRSSDLVGNTDSKTFTFSCWLYLPKNTVNNHIIYMASESDNTGFYINYLASSHRFDVIAYAPGTSTLVINASILAGEVTKFADTFNHLLISVDLTIGKFDLYVNEKQYTVSTTLPNSLLDFTSTEHRIGLTSSGYNYFIGRLSHLFLDYTYRDLSIVANRRLFITEDGKPESGLADLNPILYLPMTDAATAHINHGTGGDFTQNGVLDTASRGPNQWNCVASEFDGVDDYLNNNGFASPANSTLMVFSCTCNIVDMLAYNSPLYYFATGGRMGVYIRNGELVIECHDDTNSTVVSAATTDAGIAEGETVHIAISFDLSDILKRNILINGDPVTVDWSIYSTISEIGYAGTLTYIGRNYNVEDYFDGRFGEVYFDPAYIDLATDNPFWDANNNIPKPVRQVINETGHQPIIAMPISADNPEKNYGTGGDFTLNGGGLTGARGASEFWARSANTGGSLGDCLIRTTGIGASDSKTMSGVFCWNSNSTSTSGTIFGISNEAGDNRCYISGDDTAIVLRCENSSKTTVLETSNMTIDTVGSFAVMLFCIDLTNTANRQIYINGALQSPTWLRYINDFMAFSNPRVTIGDVWDSAYTNTWEGDQGICYFTTDYIDFSQEETRNLFVDQLGYPKDLSKQIADELIPTPLIYMPFDDPANLGKNLGTGGDFTVNGTVTQGTDFSL